MADDLLRNGRPVPDFSLSDTDGNTFSFGQRPSGNTIVTFIRGEWCPVCNGYLESLKGHLSDFASENTQWVVVGDEEVDKLREMKRRIGLDVPVPGGYERDRRSVVRPKVHGGRSRGPLGAWCLRRGSERGVDRGFVRDGSARPYGG